MYFREAIFMDKKIIYTYLKKKLDPEESREELYKAACVANEMGWNFMETSFQLGEKAVEDGLTRDVVEATIRRGFAKERRKAERVPNPSESSTTRKDNESLDLDEESIELLNSRRINPDALSIPWPSDDWRADFIKLLKSAFDPDDTIEFKVANTSIVNKEKVKNITAQVDGINKTMRALDSDDGAFMNINSIANSESTDENESFRYRYVIIDSPKMSLSKQLAYYKALNLPCAALVNSGANTVQAWVKIEATDSNEYADRVDFLYNILDEQGFRVDHANKRYNHMVRMPGVLRKGKQQYLIGTNEGAKSWKEWEEWVDYCLDGDPLAEMASYHKDPPSYDTELIPGMLRQGQTMIIEGDPKSGKSLTMVDLALSFANGSTWLDKKANLSDVLYINFEQDKNSFINRLHNVAKAKKVNPASERIAFFHLRGFHKYGIDLAKFISKRITGAKKHEDRNYKVVIIDPLHKILPPELSKEKAGAALRQFVDYLSANCGSAIIGVIPNNFIQDNSWCDSILEFKKDNKNNGIIISSQFKDFAPMSTQKYKWEFPLLVKNKD